MLNELYQSLDPVAISAGPITIYWYGIAYIVGAIITGVVMYRTQRRWGLNLTIDDLVSVVVGVVFGLIIGARLFYVVFYGDGYYLAHPLEVFAVNEGGMSFHGGLVGGILGGAIACRIYKISAWTVADLAVCGAPLALMLFCVLQILSRRKPVLPQGTFMGVFVMGYGIVRFLVEFVRVPDAQLGYLLGGVITMGQLLSLPLVAAGAVLIVYAQRKARPQCDYLEK